MKNILFVSILLFPFLSRAQDSCKLKRETDPFTHQTKVSTGFVPFTANGVQVSISVDATPTDIDFFIWLTADPKCFDDQSSIQINYDGDRLKTNFKNSGSMNCEGAFHFTFRNTEGTPTNLQRLTDKKISSLKLTNGKITTDIVFNDEQKKKLMLMAGCVVREAKTLIKK
jgi:hypothetical protein